MTFANARLRWRAATMALIAPLMLLALGAAWQAQAQQAIPEPDPAGQDVVVTAARPKTQTLIDRKVYAVSGNLQATSGSAADVLNEVPSVSVDADGGINTLRGDPNITVLVDGKPSAAFTGAAAGLSLLQFPASDIDRIEVMANPPSQFKASRSGMPSTSSPKKTARPASRGRRA